MKIAGFILISFLDFCAGYALFQSTGCNHNTQKENDNMSTVYADYKPYKGIYHYKNKYQKSTQSSKVSNTTDINQQNNVSTVSTSNDIDRVLNEWDNLSNSIVKEYIDGKEQYFNHKDPDFFNGKVYRYGNSVKSMEQTAKEYFEVKKGEFSTTQRAKLNDIYSRLDLLKQQINSDMGRNEF